MSKDKCSKEEHVSGIKKLQELIKRNKTAVVVFALAFALILTPIIIRTCSPSVSSEISADGLLSYIIQAVSAAGTIFLAYVAIRQNEQFKLENDKTQERLEKIALTANELSIIAKVIEYESSNLSRLVEASTQFFYACSVEEIIAFLRKNVLSGSSAEISLAIELRKNKVSQAFSDVSDEVMLDFDNHRNVEDVICSITNLYKATITLLDKIRQSLEDSDNNIVDEARAVIEAKKQYRENINLIIKRKRILLDSIVFNNFSYAQIKEIHYGANKEINRDEQQ